MHQDVGDEHAERQRDDGDERAAYMQQEDDTDERDDEAFLEQRRLQRRDRALDQLRAVVDGHDLRTLRQRGRDLGELRFHAVDDGERVGPETLHDDAADGLALAVELGDAAALVGCKLDAGDVAQEHRCPAFRLKHDLLDVGGPAEVAASAHHELGLGKLHHAAADVHVGGADRLAHLSERNIEALQSAGIDDDRILPLEAADARHLGHARRTGNREANLPILRGAQLRQRALGRDDGVLVDPAHARGVGPERRHNAARQLALHAGEILKDARARPVDTGAVLEDDVDEARAEKGEAAHDVGARHAQQGGRQRKGDLVLDHLRGLPGVLGVDDDLGVGEIGDGVERHLAHGIDAGGGEQRRADQHEHHIAGRPADDGGDHGWLPCEGSGAAAEGGGCAAGAGVAAT